MVDYQQGATLRLSARFNLWRPDSHPTWVVALGIFLINSIPGSDVPRSSGLPRPFVLSSSDSPLRTAAALLLAGFASTCTVWLWMCTVDVLCLQSLRDFTFAFSRRRLPRPIPLEQERRFCARRSCESSPPAFLYSPSVKVQRNQAGERIGVGFSLGFFARLILSVYEQKWVNTSVLLFWRVFSSPRAPVFHFCT